MVSKDQAAEELLRVFAKNFDLDIAYLCGFAEALTAEFRRQEKSKSGRPQSVHIRLKVKELPWLITEMVQLRKAAKLTQAQVAQKMGLSIDAIQRREGGINKFTPGDVQFLCDQVYCLTDSTLRARLVKAAEDASMDDKRRKGR